MTSLEHTIRRLQEELKQKDKEMARKDKEMAREIARKDKIIDSLRSTINDEDDLWKVTKDRHGIDAVLLHSREIIHHILNDNGKLAAMAGQDKDRFGYIYDKFEKESHSDAPLFAEDEIPDPGNRCLLDRRSVLLLALIRKRVGLTQDGLGVLFDVDQSTVSRYLKFADMILDKILPTAKKMTSLVTNTKTEKDLEVFIPDRILKIDGTEVPRQRPTDRDARKKTYSGKKKQFTFNTTIVTNNDGLILAAGRTFEGSTHDLTMIAQDPIDFGKWSKGMYKNDTPEDKKFTILGDKGYIGMEKHYPGINLIVPKKKPPKGELTEQHKKNNQKISGKRITVEHSIGRIKQWGMMNGPYDGTLEEFQAELMVTTGLANFAMLWDPKRKRPRIDY